MSRTVDAPPEASASHDRPAAGRAKLTEGSVDAHLKDLLWPMAVGILSILSKNLVDTYFVAQLGTESLSAISFTFPVVMFVMSVSIGLGAGATSVVSRVIGGGDEALVRRRCTDALMLTVIMSIGTSALGLWAIRPLFAAMGAQGRILDEVQAYMEPWFLGLVLMTVVMVANSLLRSAGNARLPGLIMVIGAAINAVLDPFLIFGWLGLPELGIAGAAWATVISNVFAAAMSLALMLRERMLSARTPSPAEVRCSWRPILAIGLPAAAANMINPLGVGIITRLLADISPEAVAGFGVATRLEGIAAVVLLAMSAAVGPVVGQNLGANLPGRVEVCLAAAFRMCVKWSLTMTVVLGVVGPLVTPLFDDHPAVQHVASLYLWLVPFSFFGYGWNIVQSAAFNAIGRPLASNFLTISRMFLIYVPASLVLAHGFGLGLVGIFAGAALGNLGGGLLAYLARERMNRFLLYRSSTTSA